MARSERARARRWWRWPAFVALGILVLLGLLFVALRTSLAREQIRVRANAALVQAFRGKVSIERLGGVSLGGLSGVDARVFDEHGQQVLWVQGLSVQASLLGLGWQLVAHSDNPELRIASIDLRYADVRLREDAEQGVTLATTFLPRQPSEPAAPANPEAGTHLSIDHIGFERVWLHGRASGSPDLDADLLGLRVSMRQSPRGGLSLNLAGVDLRTRNLPLHADPSGNLTASIDSPPPEVGPLRLEASLVGRALGSPLGLDARLLGDDLHARVDLLRVPAAFVNRQAQGLGLDGDVTLALQVDGPLPQLDFEAQVDGTAAHVEAAGYAVVSQGMELWATLAVTRADVSRIAAGAPETELALQTSALLLEEQDGHFVGGYRTDVERGRVGVQITPALWLAGKLQLDSQTGVETSGKLGAQEPGAAVLGTYRVSLPQSGGGRVTGVLDAQLDDPPRLDALGLRVGGRLGLSGELRLDSQTVAANASLDLRHFTRDVIQARNVEVKAQVTGHTADPHVHAGAIMDILSGRVHADLDYSAARQELALFATDIDLVRLARLAGTKVPLDRGTLGLDAHVLRAAPAQTYTLDATANADLGKLGTMKVVATAFDVPSSVPSLTRMGALKGELVASGTVQLAALAPLAAAAGAPIESAAGQLRFEVGAKHEPQDPDGLLLSASVDTNGLRIVEKRDDTKNIENTAQAKAAKPTAVEGIDMHFSAHTRPQEGQAVATLILRDPGGTLLDAQAEAALKSVWPNHLGDAAAWRRLPLRATVTVPERKLGSLPALIRPSALRGRIALDAKLEGSADDPQLRLQVTSKNLRASANAKNAIDVSSDVRYTTQAGSVRVDAGLTHGGQSVASVDAKWQGDLKRAPQLADGGSGLSGSADIKLLNFPLAVVPQIVDREVNGLISGNVSLKDWGKDARVDARLNSSSLVIGQVAVRSVNVSARTDARSLQAEVDVDVGSGSTKATLEADMRWGARLVPELEHRGDAKLVARGFRLETLSPLLGAYVSEVGGALDANTEIAVTPTSTTLAGDAKLDRGVLQLPAIGQRFSDINAHVTVGDNQFKLERLEAHGTTGRVSVTGAARLDGFQLQGADAKIAIKKNEALPLTLEGAALGDAWGNVNATFTNPPQGERRLDVDVPSFHLITPETSGSGLQSLDDDQDIKVGVRRADGKFVELPVQPLKPGGEENQASAAPVQPLRITVKLGNDVVVERDRTAQAQLGGQLTILSAKDTQVNGRIEVKGGKLDVQGKTFEIERGVITFEGDDPSNPTITATARWDAPGYAVYADYVGDVKNGRIKLRAEPPLSQDEIASLLMFGTPDGSMGGSSDPNAAALAVGVAGDTAAKGLNQAIDQFTNLDVSARIDTTTGSARPELVFQVSPRVSAKVTRAIGTPAAGESPDMTFLTLELRLKRSWALSALFGDHGASALDLIWRRRY